MSLSLKDRVKRALQLDRRVIKEVDEMTGGDDPGEEVWLAVAEADAAYGAASAAWVDSGSDDDLKALRAAYEALLAAWKEFS